MFSKEETTKKLGISGVEAVSSALSANQVLRNTYLLLAFTLGFTAITAFVAMRIGATPMSPLLMIVISMGLLFGVRLTAKSGFGLVMIFLFTGFMGYTLGPILSYYLSTSAGTNIVISSAMTTALTFLGLSGYVLITGKDMTFLGGFLFAGSMVVLASIVLYFVLGFMGIDLSFLSLAISAVAALLSCGYILFTTSAIINGGERNYILATVSLYVSIYNLFISLLNILSTFSGRR